MPKLNYGTWLLITIALLGIGEPISAYFASNSEYLKSIGVVVLALLPIFIVLMIDYLKDKKAV